MATEYKYYTDNGNGSVTVKSGCSLSVIANAYFKTYGSSAGCKSTSDYVKFLTTRNNVKNNGNTIYVGQVIWLSGTASSTTTSSPKRMVTNLTLGQWASDERKVLAEWDYKYHSETDHYVLKWGYSYGTNQYFPQDDATTKQQYASFDVPTHSGVPLENMKVSVSVTPVAITKKDNNGKEYQDWKGEESDRVLYEYKNNRPSDTPSAPDLEIEDYSLTVRVDNVPDSITKVEFWVTRNNSELAYRVDEVKVVNNSAARTWTDITAGATYKAKCRYINGNGESEWSPWSGDSETKPDAPDGFTTYRAESETSVYLEWNAVENADSYDIEYAEKREYLDGSNQTSIESGITTATYILSGLESGKEYFFRVRAVNSEGESGWTDIVSVIVGTEPAAPTTWASTTTVVTGEPLTLYWVHNSEDGSTQVKANIELTVNGTTTYQEIDTASEKDDEKTMRYAVDTTGYVEGAEIVWRVQTAGVTKNYGEWSVKRTVKVYAPPSVSINLLDYSGAVINKLISFPLRVHISAGPKTQVPMGYHLSIIANDRYEAADNIGVLKIVNAGDEVYSKYIDSSVYEQVVEISAGDVYLTNNVSYTVKCVLSMDSGLTGEDSRNFTVGWTPIEYDPNAMTSINTDNLTALIAPFCEAADGNLIDDAVLSVYRREFDGSFTEIATNLANIRGHFVSDPHPALDYARYRIVARSNSTGAIGYYDMAGIPVGEKAVIIQWDEVWQDYEYAEYRDNQRPWSGSMLKLPYNIDVSEENQLDVSLIEYIGRKHPVSYYGTQVGQSQSWSVTIPKTDTETIYALRRLAVWTGDVYIREPSGSGYWANISVSFSQNHCNPAIPVKFSITRVAGGM